MKARFYAIVILSGVFFALPSLTWVLPNSNNANVTIPAQQEFVLGEYQKSSFKAKLNNTSNKQMEVRVLDKETNEQMQSFGLEGKGEAMVYISKGEKVLLKNPNEEEVTVRVKLSKTVGGMRYQQIGAFEE
ncbi:hypothetical protein OAK35_01575 [Crocinitomicaceae bacterium]|nr:hypothetical protein [Crocinitomicaceae bacterium]MDC0257412.1 hypothetical protein [Crocinitomicaceae bacterium]